MKLFRPVLPNEIQITGSKSESNRLLILQKLFGNIEIKNISNSQDTNLLQKALNSDEKTIDIHHAGTAMRFLTCSSGGRRKNPHWLRKNETKTHKTFGRST